ncbi:Fic family protein (plasmid) [Oscillospiraceae bacterium PP1C4]
MIDPYVYPGTEILVNKFNIQNKADIEAREADYVSARMRAITITPVDGCFDFEHLCAIHGYIFQDIYDWAGQIRTVPMEKYEPVLGGLSIEYSEPERIAHIATTVLDKMKSVQWDTLDTDKKAEYFTPLMANLWKVHPFREGNTRTVVTFCCQFADSQGFRLDTDLFKDNSMYVRTALVAATAQFKDLGDRSQPQHLIRIVKDAMVRGQSKKPSILNKLDQSHNLNSSAKPYIRKTTEFER